MKLLGTLFIAIGILLMLAGLLNLPWIDVVPAHEFEQRRTAIVSRLAELASYSKDIPLIEEFQLAQLANPEELAKAYPVQTYGTLYVQVANGEAIRPWALLMDIPLTEGAIKTLIVVMLIALLFHPVYLIVKWLNGIPDSRIFGLGILIADALILFFAIAYVHAIDNLGLFHRPALATLRMLSVMRLAVGYPCAVLGLLVNGLGVAFLTFESGSVPQKKRFNSLKKSI